MTNSAFAAAADAINYLDDGNEESSESEEVSDVSVATSSASDDSGEDSDSDDDEDDGDMEEAVFLCYARNIQNRTSWSIGTAAMEDRWFHGLFGARSRSC